MRTDSTDACIRQRAQLTGQRELHAYVYMWSRPPCTYSSWAGWQRRGYNCCCRDQVKLATAAARGLYVSADTRMHDARWLARCNWPGTRRRLSNGQMGQKRQSTCLQPARTAPIERLASVVWWTWWVMTTTVNKFFSLSLHHSMDLAWDASWYSDTANYFHHPSAGVYDKAINCLSGRNKDPLV